MRKLKLIKLIFVLLIMITTVMIPFTWLLSRQFTKYASDEMNDFNQDKVIQTADNLDFFLNNLKAFGINIYEDERIQNWLMEEKEDIITQQIADNTMMLYLTTQPFIYKSYLINLRTESVLDSKIGKKRFSQFADQDILTTIKEHRQTFLRYFDHQIEGDSYLALIYPLTPSRKDYYGYLVLLLNKDMLNKHLLSNQMPDTANYVLDQAQHVLLGDPPIKGETGWITYGAPVVSQEWTIYSTYRLDSIGERMRSFQTIILWNFLGLLGVLIVISAWNTIRSYKPIVTLHKLIQARMDKNHSHHPAGGMLRHHDLTDIQNSVEFLLDSVDKMNQTMNEQRVMLREEHMRQWILQGKMNPAIQAVIETESKLLQVAKLYLVIIRMESYQALSEKYNFYSRKLLKFAMGNIAAELIHNEGWEVECVDLGSDHLILLIGRNDDHEPEYLAVIKQIGEQINKWLKIPNAVASSRDFSPDMDLRSIYDLVFELTMLKFVSGEDKVYRLDDFENFADIHQSLAYEGILEDIVNAVRIGKTDPIKQSLELLQKQMKHLPYETCKQHLMFITYTLFKSFSKLTIVQNIDNISHFLEKFDTLQQYFSWLENMLHEIRVRINVPIGNNRKTELTSEIIQYVRDHLQDPMLTQEQIASHLSLSYSYVRSVFKEVSNLTLADFILEERIQLVKELLIHSDSSITDIAERAGFQSKSYFFTVFKKMTGLTPNEFRKLQKME
ncbi:helix-turn-helix transcriptional regulator [Paenibacillus nasutitermitis]|uniref:HTH araC/xylS-type domain-containing protein n=1 Tax=Paenibacillus nasutitermitis TaxID=1652958 RepID=A0A917DQD9_9BACL|nr:AraC family transcriptional regulator [Paenibacillus nasutitermitis]GGD59181.1 hypothetical protein GCM10010911_16240 [Paenibacillus nasutitermitis]